MRFCLVFAVLAALAAFAQDDILQHYNAAQAFSEKGDQPKATAEYKLFLGETLRRMGNAKAQLLDIDGSGRLYEDASAFAPEDPALLSDHAAALLKQGKISEARPLAERSLALEKSTRNELLLGRILFKEGNYAAAKPHLEAAILADPNPDTGYALGVTYLRLKDSEHARMLFAEMRKGLGDTADVDVLISRAYQEAWAWREAIDYLRAAIARHPKAAQLHYFLGLAYVTRDQAGDVVLATREFRAELLNGSQDARSHYMLGFVLLRQKQYAESESELQRASSLEPDSPDPFIDLGQLYLESKRPREAELAERKAIALTTNDSHNDFQIYRAHYFLGRAFLQSGQRDEAAKELEISEQLRSKRQQRQIDRQEGRFTAIESETRGSGVSAEEQTKLRTSIDSLKPAVANAYNNLGVAAAALNNYSEAARDFERAAAWNPQLETVDRNWGMAEFYAKQYPAAIPPLERHLASHADDTRVRAALGLSYFTVENYANTLSTLLPIEGTALADPGLASAYGMSLIKAGQFDRGMNLLKEVAKKNPDSAEIHGLLGGAYADQGIYAPALEEYHKSLALDPSQAHVHFLLGLALIRQGKPAEAVPELRAALTANPADTPAKYHLAFALLQTQKKPEAKSLLEAVLKQDPQYADAYYQLGKLQLEEGDASSAVTNLERGSKLSPNSDYIHYQLAMAYRRTAQPEAASKEMKLYEDLKIRRQPNQPQN
ncbi:MAG TPA: tetratricopeptide repeat protein [Terriglobales bacterium]|nr:tetratricopeptide repeat protein [Terriglobales bacterium]